MRELPKGVTIVSLDDPAELHNAIADAIGEDSEVGETEMTQPNQAQLAALRAYARAHGRTWKSQLIQDWMSGRCEGELQQVRNTFGPRWLQRYQLPAFIMVKYE